MGVITFDGISSQSIGVTVEGYSSSPMAEKDISRVSVAGRNGDLIIDNGAFKNYNQKYKMHWRCSGENRTAVASWLYKGGYRKFVDSNDIQHFRMASFVGGVNIDNRMDVLDRAEVEFNFKPQRFLTSGETETRVNNGGTISNPTAFAAKPIIRIVGAKSGAALTINGKSISFLGDTTGYIDCETENAYGGALNSNIKCRDFPALESGDNKISWTGTIGTVYVIPRWWEL